MNILTDDQIRERAILIEESDVLCACGANPRGGIRNGCGGRAARDPAWFVASVLDTDGETRLAVVRCPRCERARNKAPELLAALRRLCQCYEMSDPDSPDFADSGADVLEALWLGNDPRELLAEIEGAE